MNRRTVILIAIVILAMLALWMPVQADDAEPTLSPDQPVWGTLHSEDSIRIYDFENDTVSTLAMISGDMDSSPRLRLIDESDNSIVAEIHFESLASLLCVLPGSYRIEVLDSDHEAGNADADHQEPFMMVMVEGCDMMSTTSAQRMLSAAVAAQQTSLNASDNGVEVSVNSGALPVVGNDDGTSIINDNSGDNGGGNNGGNNGSNNGGGNNGGGNNPTTPTCLFSTNSLSLFDSPFLAAISRLTVNATVGVLGHTADEAWLLVDVNGRIGYVATATITLPAACVSLPTITLPHDVLDLVDGVITVVDDVVVNIVCELTNTSFELYAQPELSASVSLLATAQPSLIGRTADGVWLLVNASGQIGFVAAASVDLANACGALPIINIAHDVVEVVDGVLTVVDHVVEVVGDVVTGTLETATNAVCTLSATNLSVYSSASLNANVSAAVNANGLILGRTSDNAWLLVNVNGQIGYVAAVTVNLPSVCAALPLVNIPHEVVTLVGNVVTTVSTVAAEAEDVVVEVVDATGNIVTTVVPGVVTTAIPNIVTTVVAPVSDIVTTTVPQIVTTEVPNVVATVVAPVSDIVTTTVPQVITTTVPQIVATAVPQIVTTTVPQVVTTTIPQVITTTVPNIISTVVAPLGGVLP